MCIKLKRNFKKRNKPIQKFQSVDWTKLTLYFEQINTLFGTKLTLYFEHINTLFLFHDIRGPFERINNNMCIALIKKKTKFSSSRRKFRWDRLQNHIWGRASISIWGNAQIFNHIKGGPSHIWLCNRSLLDFLNY
jgi:hypothetical protein